MRNRNENISLSMSGDKLDLEIVANFLNFVGFEVDLRFQFGSIEVLAVEKLLQLVSHELDLGNCLQKDPQLLGLDVPKLSKQAVDYVPHVLVEQPKLAADDFVEFEVHIFAVFVVPADGVEGADEGIKEQAELVDYSEQVDQLGLLADGLPAGVVFGPQVDLTDRRQFGQIADVGGVELAEPRGLLLAGTVADHQIQMLEGLHHQSCVFRQARRSMDEGEEFGQLFYLLHFLDLTQQRLDELVRGF